MRWRRCAGGAVGAHVDDCPFEITVGTLLLHLVGDWRKDLCDPAGTAPGDDVLRAASGTFKLLVGGGHVKFDTLV